MSGGGAIPLVELRRFLLPRGRSQPRQPSPAACAEPTPAWESTRGEDGYVSFELDPLLEDPDRNLPDAERTNRYVELGKPWSAGHKNRMIKVPNTDARVAALEELVAAG